MQPTITLQILEAVSESSKMDPLELPPITDVFDADALNQLWTTANSADTPLSVQFEYAGHTVEVNNDTVRVVEKEPRP